VEEIGDVTIPPLNLNTRRATDFDLISALLLLYTIRPIRQVLACVPEESGWQRLFDVPGWVSYIEDEGRAEPEDKEADEDNQRNSAVSNTALM
jgi:hypothetical protein